MRSNGELRSEFRAALEAVTPSAPWLAATVKERLRARQNSSWKDQGRRELRIGFNVVAILLLIAIALATVGVFLAIHQSIGPAGRGAGLLGFPTKMVSPTTGWGHSFDSIVRTTDGGAVWTDVSPPGWEQSDPYTHIKSDFFLDANRAWATESSITGPQIIVFRTTDGGQRWQRVATIAVTDVGFIPNQLDFIDPVHGWFKGSKPDLGLGLYSTDDGGQHWKRIDIQPGPQDSGCARMAFVSVSTGWIVCSWSRTVGTPSSDRIAGDLVVEGGSTLSVTHDGGVTWVDSPLPVPAEKIGLFDPPAFFDQMHGILVLDLASPETLLVTSDGGATWSQRSLPGNPPLQIPADFIDAMHGWVVASSVELGQNPLLLLYRTDDGGASWVQVQTDVLFASDVGGISRLYFVNQKEGFALRENVEGGSFFERDTLVSPSEVLKTTDGGQTWSVVARAS